MRDRETIDSELRQIAQARRSVREQGGQPSSRQADELLDERLAHRAEASETKAVEACETELDFDAWSQREDIDDITPHGRKGVLRRFAPLAALPLSLVAVAAALVVIFAVHQPDPAAQPAVVPPPSSARPNPAPPPKAHAPPPDIVDMAFIAALKKDGVPVPSQEYVMTHGHAVCDFLAHQPSFEEAIRFVQQSTIWDANQSADFAAGAMVSYCPQHEPAGPVQMQQGLENALSDLQRIQGDLKGIQGDLQGTRDGLQPVLGPP